MIDIKNVGLVGGYVGGRQVWLIETRGSEFDTVVQPRRKEST